MNLKNLKLTILLVIVFTSIFSLPSYGLDEPENSSTITFNRKINFKIWGFDQYYYRIVSNLLDTLPSSYIYDSKTDTTNRSTFQANYNGYTYHYQDVFTYEFDYISSGSVAKTGLFDIINSTANKGKDISKVLNNSYDGWSISVAKIDEYISNYNEKDMTTIHILDFSTINELESNYNHWYKIGVTESIDQLSEDMRNIAMIPGSALFFDPTAIAPLFDNNTEILDNVGSNEWYSYISDKLSLMIEYLVSSSPLSSNRQQTTERKIHVAQLLIVNNTLEDFAIKAIRNLQYEAFKSAMSDILPYISIEFKQFIIRLDSNFKIEKYLKETIVDINGTPSIIVSNEFSEGFKSLIREEVYTEYPSGYFYPLFIMANSNYTEYVHKNNNSVPYETGNVGFSLMNMKAWKFELFSNLMIKEQIRIMGKTFGITELSEKFVSQIESPMSSYGVSYTWDRKFTQLEKNSLSIRTGISFRQTTYNEIRLYREALRNSPYIWINRTVLDDIELEIILGDYLLNKGLLLNSTVNYIKAFDMWEETRDEIVQTIKTVTNSIYFTMLMSIFIYLIYSINKLGLPLNEYRKKYSY